MGGGVGWWGQIQAVTGSPLRVGSQLVQSSDVSAPRRRPHPFWMLCCRIECWKMLVGHLAVLGWLLLPSPVQAAPQNNTCYRVESVEVRVAVPLQEPATFRSYTWCLKVPPRCSKYTVVMRERITYQTEVRNQTVMECCPGFVRLYDDCVSECSTCTNMRCDKAGNCACAAGYHGNHCNHSCEPGRWGDRCSEACICRVGEDCDVVSGNCTPSTTTSTSTTPSTSTTTSTSMSPPSTALPMPTMPHTTRRPPATSSYSKNIPTTPNAFINLTPTEPTTSTEDLSDFGVISKPQRNDSVRMTGNDEINSLNSLGDFDYPVLPTDSAGESVDSEPEYEPTKNIVVNSLSVNTSVVNDRWNSELGANSGVTLGSGLALLALLIVVVSSVIRCRNQKAAQHSKPVDNPSLQLVARNSHYAVPSPPSFSFINGYTLDLGKERSEDEYDHPRSARCLTNNEHIYDELRY